MSDTHRQVGLERLGRGRYRVTNARGGEMVIGDGSSDDFTPVELLLAAVAFLFLVFAAPASQFQNDFLKDHRGFTASGITLYTILTTTPAGVGIFLAGRLADTRGRRGVATVGLLGGTTFLVLSYHASGVAMWGAHLVGVVVGSLTVAMGVYGPELFSTRHRARANGLIVTLGVAGSASGLLLVGVLADRLGSYGHAFSIAAIGPLLREKGQIFVGIDVIGDYLTEINVTSPTGIQELERFDGTNIAAKIWEAIERKRA